MAKTNHKESNFVIPNAAHGQSSSSNSIGSSETTTISTSSTGEYTSFSNQTTTEPSITDVIKQIQPYVISAGVGILFLLLIINLVSIIQRRKDHRVVHSYLLSLHTLLPFLTRYDDIPNVLTDINMERTTSKSKQHVFGNHIEDYDEIGIVARRSKLKSMGELDLKRISEVDDSKKDVTSQEETSEDRSTVYSLQKEVFSSDL